jgi:excisionase family DNA binding protein
LISSNDLATRLGLSRATVLRAVARGLLKPAIVTPGGHRRFLVDDFADRIEELARQTRSRSSREELVSSSEAARLLGVSQPTLNRAVREGRVRPAAVTPGGHRRFATEELLEALCAARTFPAASSLVRPARARPWSEC